MFVLPVPVAMTRDSRPRSRLFDGAFERAFSAAAGAESAAARTPALDVTETERSYTVQLDMPGVAKDDVKVSVEGRRVTVEAAAAGPETPNDGERVVYRERTALRYARSFTLPLALDPAETTARLERGVLTLTLPKLGVRAAARIVVN